MKKGEIRISYTKFVLDEATSEIQNLMKEAISQTDMSYAPYSKFKVGAAILLENNKIVGGNNQENIAYPSGLCAERTAMFYANSQYPDVRPTTIAIAAKNEEELLEHPIYPCGSCLQVLLETQNRYGSKIKVILYGQKECYEIDSIEDMLPFGFNSFS